MSGPLATVAGVVVPVFGLVALGYGAARLKLLAAAVGEGLAEFVYVVAVPVLLFRTLARAQIEGVSPWPLWLTYFAAVAIVWTLGALLLRRVFDRDARAGLAGGVTATFSNVVMISLPFATAAFGEAGSVPVTTLIAVHLPVMMIVSTLLAQRAERLDGTAAGEMPLGEVLHRIAMALARNPLVIGIVAGAVWRFAGLGIPGLLQGMIDYLVAAAQPCALFALGMSLATYSVRGNVAPALAVTALKLLLLPLVVYLLASRLTDLPPLWVNVATLAAASPTGVNAWLIAHRIGAGVALSGNVITLSSGLAVLTMSAWLAFLTL